ncbi:ParA family protein [Fusobacterium sp. FSA-380-WT-2B]|uniref:ParA family protein n=1 Tax=Fusobacterium sp. FSA-380-WT-2B TaxID=2605786 RepID=UPI0012B412DA|nr:ParA family protein [Fusobacterium sp. FSA-380-WT-2B]MSS62148.1 ParA family protein [Fusobacterium sp. FSA-380-WT-2B]
MILLIKNNKGGIGKSFLTCQIAKGLALAEKKVLVLTSDTQNNVFNMLAKGELDKKGLLASMREKKDYSLKLHNFRFLPLEKTLFVGGFKEKFNNWINGIKKDYDYIIIDSTPVLNLDKVFIDVADKVIIPVTCDESTFIGTLNIMESIDIKKILCFIINKYENTKVQKKYRALIEKWTTPDNLFIVKKSSQIEQIIESKKTVWDYKNKQVEEIQEVFYNVISKIILESES